MAKGQYLSKHQQGIVKRYYEHADTRQLQRLSELASDLALASDAKSADRLWKSVEGLLVKLKADPAQVRTILGERSVEALARLASQLSAR